MSLKTTVSKIVHDLTDRFGPDYERILFEIAAESSSWRNDLGLSPLQLTFLRENFREVYRVCTALKESGMRKRGALLELVYQADARDDTSPLQGRRIQSTGT